MGKWIDRAAISALTAFGLYLLFLTAYESMPTALLLTFACCIILFTTRTKRKSHFRMTRFQAQMLLEQWAYGPDCEAESQIRTLLAGSEGDIVYLPRHPSASISQGDVFSAWKSHVGTDRLILSAPCYADGRARTFAATLRNPPVRIVDAAKLIPMIRKSELPIPRSSKGKQLLRRLRACIAELPGRRPWHKNLLTGLGLMLVYLITGNGAYLALSVASLFICGVSLRVRT